MQDSVEAAAAAVAEGGFDDEAPGEGESIASSGSATSQTDLLGSSGVIHCAPKKGKGYMIDPSCFDQRVGPLFRFEEFEISVVETLLRLKQPLEGAVDDRVVTRKGEFEFKLKSVPSYDKSVFLVRLTKFYMKTTPTGQVRASLPIEFPASYAEGMASTMTRVSDLVRRAPKPSVSQFLKRSRNNVDDDGMRGVKIARLKYGKD